jgi:glycosyltransferase involved in cell wall biosynthesis
MPPPPLVSIIIPLYNSEKYIADTINSAIQQTWPNKEIIIIDDGSTDNSLATIRQFESDYIKIHTQKNQGASAARNRGLQLAKGKYIQFLDADDLLSANKIEAQIELLADYPGYIGLCGTIHFKDSTDPLSYPLKHEWFSEGSDNPVDFLIKLYGGALIGSEYGGMVQPNAWLTPRELIDKAGPWNEMRNPDDDGEFFCRVILAGKGVRYSDKAINYYRKFNNLKSWSAQKNYQACSNLLQSTKLKAQHLLAKTNDPNARLALSRLFWDNAFNFYPKYANLAMAAEYEAKVLAPYFNYNPYTGFKKHIANISGWKTVAYIQYLKALFIRRI